MRMKTKEFDMNIFKEEFAKIRKRYYESTTVPEIDSLKDELYGKTIVVFGTGEIGHFYYRKLESMGLAVTCFVDNFVIYDPKKHRFPIIQPNKLRACYPDAAIIISCDKACDLVYNQLLELGYNPSQLIKYSRVDFFEPHLQGYEWAYNFFKDDISKKIILQRIKGYLFGDSMDRSSECKQYFEDSIIKLDQDEIFIDGGFYTGDTTEEFI